MPRAATRGIASAAGLLLLGACALIPAGVPRDGDIVEIDGLHYRIEQIPRGPRPLEVVAPGWLNHPQRGLLALHAETASAYLIRIALANPLQASAPSSSPPATEAVTASATLQPAGRFVELETALPRKGEWREQFALTAVENAGTQLITTPARKTLTAPAIWSRDAQGRWQRVAQRFPDQAYDYGGIAIADFDADGQRDLAMGMHLLGFAALFGDAAEHWRDASIGLPHSRRAGEITGSGIALATLPDPAGDRLLLLPEPDGRGSRFGVDLGLAEFRWRGDRWVGESLGRQIYGSKLDMSRLPGCVPLLAVTSNSNNQIPLFQRESGQWTSTALPLEHAQVWITSALTLGQFDGSGCADLLAAQWQRGPSGWHSTLAMWVDGGDQGWKPLPLPQLPRQFTLSALWAERRDGLLHIVAGSAEGDLLHLRGETTQLDWIGHLPASPWRRGCGVTQIAALPGAEARWIVAFAGDGDRFDPQRCSSNGGLVEVAWESTAAD